MSICKLHGFWTYFPIRGKEVTMDVFVQRGGPAFVLDVYQWYSSTAPLYRIMRGGKKKGQGTFGGGKTEQEMGENKSTALTNKKHSLEGW